MTVSFGSDRVVSPVSVGKYFFQAQSLYPTEIRVPIPRDVARATQLTVTVTWRVCRTAMRFVGAEFDYEPVSANKSTRNRG